ncbi:MAG: hybrid sensor histidine kinase/response regulator [Methylophilaceae bacterium 17-44-8]|nr:MAG: hybrid sensor histidine kinase/response regulator [Methylophilaceae bacterium 17-44-8]
MSNDFDIGPLTWVKEEIDKSLHTVLENLNKYSENISDTAFLRYAQTHVYQASGALDMVGLEGCKFFCSELEKCISKLEQNEITSTPELNASLMHAVNTLLAYLESLMKGAHDVPLRLFDALAPIVLAQGGMLEKSDLFFPDTSHAAPKDIPTVELDEAAYIKFLAEQRQGYQKSLLSWLKAKEAYAVDGMVTALANVSEVQTRSAPKMMWWSASAFAQSLHDPDVAELAGAKRLCRKIDQELKLLLDGTSKANPQMLKDILYYVAESQADYPIINKAKQVYDLHSHIDHAIDHLGHGVIEASEIAVTVQLAEVVASVGDVWNEVSNKIDFHMENREHTTISVDHSLMVRCHDILDEHQPLCQQLSQVVVIDLYQALAQVIDFLKDGAGQTTHPILIEVAAGIHLLETALQEYTDLDATKIQKLLSEIQRLELIASGAAYTQLAHDRTNDLDADTMKVVISQIQESLQIVEQVLDGFFRHPEDKSPLGLTIKPLREVASIFQMLNAEVPSTIAKQSLDYVEFFQSDFFVSNQGEFELLAESISMLSLYAEGMPKIRPEYEAAMEAACARMNVVLANALGSNAVTHATEVDLESADVALPAVETQAAILIDKALDEELLDIYLTEAEEVLAHIANHLQLLKVSASHESLVEVRRGFHTLKGSGRTVGLSGLGEVAGKVESFLNGVLDNNKVLSNEQLQEVEQVTAEFATWSNTLREQQSVSFSPDIWIARIEQWGKPSVTKARKKKAIDDVVMIGGTRKLSRQLYNIFLNESMVNITTLEQDMAKMNAETPAIAPSSVARRAIHTLASNALAAGFTHMGALGRAVEQWLDEVGDDWSPAQHKLYSRVIKSVARMWQRISDLNEPKEEKALIKAVREATPSIKRGAKQAESQVNRIKSTPLAPSVTVTEHVEVDAPTVHEELTATESEPIHEEDASNQIADEVKASVDVALNDVEDVSQEASEEQSTLMLEDIPETYAPPAAEEHPDLVDAEILNLFQEEADELLPAIGNELRAWHANYGAVEHADALLRALHTLKGSARMAGKHNLGNIVHNMEERITRALKSSPDAQTFEDLFADLDAIGLYFEDGHLPEHLTQLISSDTDNVEDVANTSPAAYIPVVSDNEHQAPTIRHGNRTTQFLRMRADVLDRLINEAGEISIIRSRIDKEVIGFKHTSQDLTDSVSRLRNYLREIEIEADTQLQSRLTLLQEANEKFDPLEFDRFTRLQELTRMMAESVNDISTIQNGLISNLGHAEAALQQQTRMNRELQQTLMNVRMLPFSQLSERMDRIVRQTARELNKRVDFIITGDKTEIDRSVLDKIGAPLEHLLRNAVAHGIELPADRKNAGKPEVGKLRLHVVAENDEIHIQISDDGAGVNLKRVKEIAIQNNVIAADAEVNDQALMAVIFEPGFSTSSEVTQIAGRGVGLDVVRSEVTGLGGRIDIDSRLGEGTQFFIYLPVTLTVAQVLMVRAGATQYAISVAMIEQAQKVKQSDIAKAYEAGEIVWAGNSYPLHHINKLLNESESDQDHAYASVLLLRSGTYRIALHVDEMLGNQEVVIKPIGVELARVPGIMGATVTGDGSVILILNPLLLANREGLAAGSVKVKMQAMPVAHKLKALVVDDSLTMRKVLGRLLEREGFEVLVAKDGMDAMQLLQTVTPDIILTDIEMPRMDGFGLSRNIRDDARTANTPLIMISSRTADKHQNLAKDIGVDAFFGKPVHDEELVAKVNELIQQRPTLH